MIGWIAAGAAAGILTALGAYAVRGRSSQWLCTSYWRGRPNVPAVALTFDDGPGPATAEILSILDRYGVPATFFFCGENVERRPELARRVVEVGHELGNHSYSHPYFCFRSREFIRQELHRTQAILEQVTGCRPRWFRPPYGIRWLGLQKVLDELGLVCVTWTVIGNDWKWPGPVVAEHVLRRVVPGAIICLHDGRETRPEAAADPTIEAVRILVPGLLNRGFRFETISNLLCWTSSNNA